MGEHAGGLPQHPSDTLPLRDHGVALRPPPLGSWERWAVQVRAVGTGQDERDSGLCLCLVLSQPGPLSFLTPTAARTRRDADGVRWGNLACRACVGVPVRGTYLYS
jgi:hypothetical protein